MTSTNDKIRALFLTALMVVSVFGATVAFSGAAAANHATATLAADGGSPVEYTNSSGEQQVEFALAQDLHNANNWRFVVEDRNGDEVFNESATHADVNRTSLGTGAELVRLNLGTTDLTGSATLIVENTSADDPQSFAITTTSASVFDAANADINIYKGETIAIVGNNTDSDYEVFDEDGTFLFSGGTGANATVAAENTDTDNFATGEDVQVRFDGGNNVNVSVRNLGLSIAVDDANTDDRLDADTGTATVSFTVTSNVADRAVEVVLEDSDGDVVGTETANLGGDREATVSFTVSAVDDYTATVTDLDTDIQDTSDAVSVAEALDSDADFATSVVTEQRGDVAAITVEFSGDPADATIHIGGENVGFLASGVISDGNGDGEVTVLFNTFETPNDDATYLTVEDEDDSITSRNEHINPPRVIESGTYDLNVTIDGTETDVAALSLQPRSTDDISTSVAPASDTGADAVGADTASDEVAQDDQLVVTVEASGLYGYLSGNGLNETADGLSVKFEQTNPVLNQDPNVFWGNESTVVIDADNDTFHLVVDTEDVEGTQGAIEVDDEYEVTFTINDSNKLQSEDESVSTNVTVVARETAFDTDPVVVRPQTDQEVTGTSSIAPGSTFPVRVRSTGDAPFLKSETAVVQDDGTWNVSFDFSDVAVGTEFDATTSNPDAEADGRVSGPSTVSFSDQETGGAAVVVDEVYLPAGGFVAIHEGDAAGPVIGASGFLEAGTHENVRVSLDEPYEDAQTVTLVAMPHRDTNSNNLYEFPDADGPFLDNGSAVTDDATVEVVESTPTPRVETRTVVQDTPSPRVETRTVEVTRTVIQTETPGQPGFGIAVAVLALLAAALLAVRRHD